MPLANTEKTDFKYKLQFARVQITVTLGLGSPRGHAVDPSTERSPPTPNTVMKAMSDHALQQTEEFRRRIDKHMGLPSRTPDAVRLLPDPQFKIAQQSEGEQSKKRRYGSSEGRAQVECVKRIALGGKVTDVDARVVGVPKALMQKQAEKVFATGRVEDTEHSQALSRAAARAAEVGHAAVYTEEEYDSCVVDALKKDRGTQKELSLKYGPSVTSMKRGMTHVRSYIKETNRIVSDQECDRIIDSLPDEDLRVVLKTLRRNGTVQKMGGKCLLTDQEITAVLATVGVMGHTCVGTTPGTHRAKVAHAINEYGEEMLQRIEKAEQRGEYVDPKEKHQATRYANAKVCAKTWDAWRRKYNGNGAVGEGTEVGKARKPSKLSHARDNLYARDPTAGAYATVGRAGKPAHASKPSIPSVAFVSGEGGGGGGVYYQR